VEGVSGAIMSLSGASLGTVHFTAYGVIVNITALRNIMKRVSMRYSNLRRQIGNCSRCRLHNIRRNIVIGRGVIPADVLFLGEAPGNSEDVSGIPFFGDSGKLLDKIILETGMSFTYYISNAVMCHPSDKIGGSNREPLEDEVFACRSNVIHVYNTVKPKKTIFIGHVSELYYKKVFKPNATIYHPSFLLRTGGKASPYYLLTVRKLMEAVCTFAD